MPRKGPLDLCNKMRLEQLVPNSTTFTLLLALCSHVGLLKEEEKLFNVLSSVYGVFPTIEHYSRVTDPYGRAGRGSIGSIYARVYICRIFCPFS